MEFSLSEIIKSIDYNFDVYKLVNINNLERAKLDDDKLQMKKFKFLINFFDTKMHVYEPIDYILKFSDKTISELNKINEVLGYTQLQEIKMKLKNDIKESKINKDKIKKEKDLYKKNIESLKKANIEKIKLEIKKEDKEYNRKICLEELTKIIYHKRIEEILLKQNLDFEPRRPKINYDEYAYNNYGNFIKNEELIDDSIYKKDFIEFNDLNKKYAFLNYKIDIIEKIIKELENYNTFKTTVKYLRNIIINEKINLLKIKKKIK